MICTRCFLNILRIISKTIDNSTLKVYNSVKKTNLRGGACHENQLQKIMDTAD